MIRSSGIFGNDGFCGAGVDSSGEEAAGFELEDAEELPLSLLLVGEDGEEADEDTVSSSDDEPAAGDCSSELISECGRFFEGFCAQGAGDEDEDNELVDDDDDEEDDNVTPTPISKSTSPGIGS